MCKDCPICGRKMLGGNSVNEHHLIPRTFKGKEKILIHRICHRKIHSVFTERELLQYYHTIKRIKENEEIKKFVKWVSKKDPEFYSGSKTSNNKGV